MINSGATIIDIGGESTRPGSKTVDEFHRELGLSLWENCGMSRYREGLSILRQRIPELRDEFWQNVNVPGSGSQNNGELEKAA